MPQTDEVVQCLKLISRPGTERIVRYAYEYARRHGRRRVTCITKDNIMKLTDGLFHKVFDEVGAEYPDLEKDHMIVDIGAARLAETPDRFDVILAPNLYGDILSDIAAEVTGSVGLAGSANIGDAVAMFEAVHGSAPDIAGKGVANPSGLLNAAVLMLVHIGQPKIAEKIKNAWLTALESGMHTGDVFEEGTSKKRVGTQEFAQVVIDSLGHEPTSLPATRYAEMSDEPKHAKLERKLPARKETVGVDVFLNWRGSTPEDLATQLQRCNLEFLKLTMITNRGVKVWPGGFPETFRTDHWRGRFTVPDGLATSHEDIVELLRRVTLEGLDFIKIENLCTFDGEPGFSLGQGQ